MTAHPCKSCHWRVAQRGGFCATCLKDDFTHRVDRVPAAASTVRRADPPPQPDRSVVIDGTEYLVVFDGRQSLLGTGWL